MTAWGKNFPAFEPEKRADMAESGDDLIGVDAFAFFGWKAAFSPA
jgi:hypothetical protein